MRVLLVTNDFPPRVGGIQSYLWNIYARLEPSSLTVLAPEFGDAVAFDRTQAFEIVRWPGRVYWPTAALTRRVRELARAHRADAVAFGAVLPMNLIVTKLDVPAIVHTHGFEVAWARLPALKQTLRRIGRRSHLVTVISDYTRRFLSPAFGADAPIAMLRTGVDLERFHPGVDGSEVRRRHGLSDAPVVACVSRLVPRKGQDRIIQAMPAVLERVPDAFALIAGDGPYRRRLEAMARRLGVGGRVVFTGQVPEAELPATYAAGDVFAMPCRSRWANLEVEGLGIVYLEAQACGRPAIAGDSGGAPEALVAGGSGFVVTGRDHRPLAARLVELLSDRGRARDMGAAGRSFVEANHRWDDVVARYQRLLEKPEA